MIEIVYQKTLDSQLGNGNTTVTLSGDAGVTRVLVGPGIDWDTAADILEPTGTAVSAWNLVATGDSGTNNPHVKVWSGVVSNTSGTIIGHGVDADAFGMIIAGCKGVDTTTATSFLDGNNNANSAGATTAHTANGVDPTGADDLLLVFTIAANSDGIANTNEYGTPNAGMTRQARVIFDSGATRFLDLAAYSEQLASDAATGTRSLTYPVAVDYASVTVAIKAAAAATGKAPAFISQHSYF